MISLEFPKKKKWKTVENFVKKTRRKKTTNSLVVYWGYNKFVSEL